MDQSILQLQNQLQLVLNELAELKKQNLYLDGEVNKFNALPMHAPTSVPTPQTVITPTPVQRDPVVKINKPMEYSGDCTQTKLFIA